MMSVGSIAAQAAMLPIAILVVTQSRRLRAQAPVSRRVPDPPDPRGPLYLIQQQLLADRRPSARRCRAGIFGPAGT
jgi:hypothetical protein